LFLYIENDIIMSRGDYMTIIYTILAIVAVFFLMQYGMVLKMKFKKGKPAPELKGCEAQSAESKDGALFYFYSDGCGACKTMTPIISDLAKTRKNVFKVDIASDMSLARKFGVMGTPSLVKVQEGKIAEFLVGPQSEGNILKLLN